MISVAHGADGCRLKLWKSEMVPDFTAKWQEPVFLTLLLWTTWTASHCPLFCFSLGLDNMLGLTLCSKQHKINPDQKKNSFWFFEVLVLVFFCSFAGQDECITLPCEQMRTRAVEEEWEKKEKGRLLNWFNFLSAWCVGSFQSRVWQEE